MSSVLERRYRLLLGAYPSEYLDSHEEEILGTLLEGAKPGQLRPTFVEATSIVLHGLRARLRSSADGRQVRSWSDSVRIAALLLLASVLSDRLASGSDVVPLIGSAVVACSIVAVVMGAQRVGAFLALLSLVVNLIVAEDRSELWFPSALVYDCASLLAVAFALSSASMRAGPRRAWPGWLGAIVIAVPFLYRLFWLGSLDEYQVPLSIFEFVLPVAAFLGVALLMHDPRQAIAATIYGALHLVLPLSVGLVYRGIDIWSWALTLTLTAAALTVAVATSRRQVADLALPHTSDGTRI